MHYLITGHTGFKGAWLTLLLKHRGHTVSGIALDPLPGALFETAAIQQDLEHDIRLDIRDADGVKRAFQTVSPDIVVHMAAQPLVRESYRNPRYTYETNVNGTLNVLEATQVTANVKAQLIVTTDKVYRNTGKSDGYIESDPLGGDDPYSASKAMADILTQSWIKSFPGIPTAIARAGNVIGGGDVSPERLLPDLLRAFDSGIPAQIRYPSAVRPWQHVLDCLNAYTTIIDMLVSGGAAAVWNVGPETLSLTVGQVADLAVESFGAGATWIWSPTELPEAEVLTLSSERLRTELGWINRVSTERAIEWALRFPRDGYSVIRDRASSEVSEFERLQGVET